MTRFPPERIKPALWLLVALLVAVLAGATAWQVWSLRESAVRTSEETVERFVSGAEVALNHNMLSIDLLLSGAQDMLQLQPSADVQAESRMLAVVARGNLLVSRVAVVDAQGRVRASSEPSGALQEMSLPTAFLAGVVSSAAQRLYISTPVLSFASTQQVLYFARPLAGRDGQRLAAVAEVPLAKLANVLTQGHEVSGLEIVFEQNDGRRMLALPDLPEAGPIPALRNDVPLPDRAWNTPARISGKPALVVSRQLVYPNLRVSVSLPEDQALERWEYERNMVAAAALVFCAMVLVAAAVTVAGFDRMAQVRKDIADSKALLDQALESMVSGFVLLDAQQRVVHWNRRFIELFPWMRGVIAPGMSFRKVLEQSVVHHLPAGSDAERQQWIALRLAQQREGTGVHEQVLPDGHCIHMLERATPEGGWVITYHDVTDLRRANEEIEHLAFYDPLTGLPNRRLLLDRLGQALVLSQRSGKVGALLFLDLDHFKDLNDTLGHEVGDELLQAVAQRLLANVRVADTVARLGGDEFVVMLRDLSTNTQEAAALAQRIGEQILRGLSEPYVLRGHTHQGAASIGATLFGASAQSASELLRQADIAMYQVKARRGNALCFFDPKMQTAINDRAQLEADLRQALITQQLVLHFQPQASLQGEVVGAECLLRWQHPQRGMVPPGQFIAVAEESDLILHIGQWVLHSACSQLASWQDQPQCAHLQLSVNVSARQFRQSDFVHQVIETLQVTGARAQLLTLELTESLVLDNVEDAIDKMHQLRTKGVRFSVDDFGTGYSSLAYLTRLPLHQLKIDQSFVRNLGVRPSDDVIVQTIIGMGRNLDLEVLAEGVETEAQKALLIAHGCDLYQGYLLAHPMPVADFERMLNSGAA
jgi:diguanylate cyclase (GGDEF)-like protein/PAS domain S-box-containing protein